jgi:hypothetical protein
MLRFNLISMFWKKNVPSFGNNIRSAVDVTASQFFYKFTPQIYRLVEEEMTVDYPLSKEDVIDCMLRAFTRYDAIRNQEVA